jgi:hypothetical protein
MPDTIAPPADPTLRALALAHAGEADTPALPIPPAPTTTEE